MMWQGLAWLLLLLFGFGYNYIVAHHIKRGTGDFMARFVALGCALIVLTQTAAAQTWREGAQMLIAFACGGLGMAWGSWQRRERGQYEHSC